MTYDDILKGPCGGEEELNANECNEDKLCDVHFDRSKEYWSHQFRGMFGKDKTLCRNAVRALRGPYTEEPMECLLPETCRGEVNEGSKWWEGSQRHHGGCCCHDCMKWYVELKG